MRNKLIEELVIKAVKELGEELGKAEFQSPNLETRIYGGKSGFDSLALVSLIADIEEKLGKAFNQDIILADERAMSQTRSPFRQVSSLVNYIESLLKKED